MNSLRKALDTVFKVLWAKSPLPRFLLFGIGLIIFSHLKCMGYILVRCATNADYRLADLREMFVTSSGMCHVTLFPSQIVTWCRSGFQMAEG